MNGGFVENSWVGDWLFSNSSHKLTVFGKTSLYTLGFCKQRPMVEGILLFCWGNAFLSDENAVLNICLVEGCDGICDLNGLLNCSQVKYDLFFFIVTSIIYLVLKSYWMIECRTILFKGTATVRRVYLSTEAEVFLYSNIARKNLNEKKNQLTKTPYFRMIKYNLIRL